MSQALSDASAVASRHGRDCPIGMKCFLGVQKDASEFARGGSDAPDPSGDALSAGRELKRVDRPSEGGLDDDIGGGEPQCRMMRVADLCRSYDRLEAASDLFDDLRSTRMHRHETVVSAF